MKKLYIHLIILLIQILPFIASAQTIYEGIVYLKNGSILRGTVIEQPENKTIKIQTADANIFIFHMADVDRITKTKVKETPGVAGAQPAEESAVKNKKYNNITELNFGIPQSGIGGGGGRGGPNSGNSATSNAWIGIQTVGAYLFNPGFSAGLGLGYDSYAGTGFVPVFADIRAYLNKNTNAPYFAADLGYNFSTVSTAKAGLFINPILGLKCTVSKGLGLNFSFGYRAQEMRHQGRGGGPGGMSSGSTNYYYSYDGYFNFRVGATF